MEASVELARYCCTGKGNAELTNVGKFVLYYVDHDKMVGQPLTLGIVGVLRGSGYTGDHQIAVVEVQESVPL